MAKNIFERLVESADTQFELDISSITLINPIGKWTIGTENPAFEVASIAAHTFAGPEV